MGDVHIRSGIRDLNFIRPGSLSLTPRGLDQSPDWASDEIRTIQVSLGLCSRPLELRVRRINPMPLEAVSRLWIGPDGHPRATQLAPYAVADLAECSRTVHDYIRDECVCFSDAVRNSHPAIRMVYGEVGRHLQSLRTTTGSAAGESGEKQIRLADLYCELWFGIRNMMGSSWICGSDTLGMKPVDEEGYPLRGKVSLPRQVVQSVGCLFNTALLPLQGRFLAEFQTVFDSDPGTARSIFYTVFLIVFVLLHECEDISKDRERYARQNFQTDKFSLPQYVEALHKSARLLVEYWLDFSEALGVDWSSLTTLDASLSFLPTEQRKFVVMSFASIVQLAPVVRASPKTWTQDLCFVTHMFGVSWEANATYVAV